MDVRSLVIYGGSFLVSLIFMGLAQIFDSRMWQPEGARQVLIRRRVFLPFLLVSYSVPVLLASVRKDVGTDFYNYQVLYRMINAFTTLQEFLDQSIQTEPGYMLLNVAAFRLFHHEQMIFVLCALIIYGLFLAGIVREHEHHSVMLALFVFYACFFFQSMNILRQYIAMGIVFCTFRHICDRRFLRFFLWVLCASLFHNTALLVLPFYFLYGRKRWHRWLKYACYGGLLLLLAACAAAPALLAGLGAGEMSAGLSGHSLGLGILVKRMPLLGLVAVCYPEMKKRDSRCQVWLSLYLISIIIYHFGYFYVVFNRMGLFFEVVLIHLLPAAVRSIRKRPVRAAAGLLIFLYLCLWCWQSMMLDNLGTCLPYQTIFEG